jgi:integrase
MGRAFVGLTVSRAGSREINEFRGRIQQRVQASYDAETAERVARGLGPRKGRDPEGWPTANKIMVMISAMFTPGRRWGLLRLASDPTVERAHPTRQRMSVGAISTMAWAGTRPSEAFTDTSGGIYRDAGRLWVVEKKRQRARHASREKGRRALLLRPLLDDLDRVLELRSGIDSGEPLLWLSTEFDEEDLRNWRRRWFEPAAEAVGVEATPKTLRHSFASVSAAGINDVVTAAEMGHSLTVHRDKYVKPLTRYAAVPFTGTEGAERMIYEARRRATARVAASLERKGS